MGLVDKFIFESRGAHGCSNSDYTFAMTSCCERVGVIDDELSEFYWSSETPSRSVSLLNGSSCPFCDASDWHLRHIDRPDHVPDHWRWACGNGERPGSRRVRPLSEHVRELVAFCQRVAAPVPAWDTALLLNTMDPRVRYDRGWIVTGSALVTVAEFAPHFEKLLLAGYPWINLSAYGIFRNHLVVGVELPGEPGDVPAGLTSVNYSAPSFDANGTPRWALSLLITE
ncbi:MAG TPA: hypothetical protein VI072_03515 [Polyangiaceae bacterium]